MAKLEKVRRHEIVGLVEAVGLVKSECCDVEENIDERSIRGRTWSDWYDAALDALMDDDPDALNEATDCMDKLFLAETQPWDVKNAGEIEEAGDGQQAIR